LLLTLLLLSDCGCCHPLIVVTLAVFAVGVILALLVAYGLGANVSAVQYVLV